MLRTGIMPSTTRPPEWTITIPSDPRLPAKDDLKIAGAKLIQAIFRQKRGKQVRVCTRVRLRAIARLRAILAGPPPPHYPPSRKLLLPS